MKKLWLVLAVLVVSAMIVRAEEGTAGSEKKAIAAPTAEEYVAVESDMLDGVHYMVDAKVLFLKFDNGDEYLYEEVPGEVFEAFMKADSKGMFFNENIKNKFVSKVVSKMKDKK